MRVWLYYRLSRDEDEEQNSLTNQRNIIYDYAVKRGHTIVGESFDDNVSGMHFDRDGIEKIYEAVNVGLIDAVIVKDLSRLGRHRTQTALFLDYLKRKNVRVLSATEDIDTFNENDDLLIGFKGLINDFYARDGSRRVRTGLRQKQKNGLVITPPFGYFKDKNTNEVKIVPESADTVRFIYNTYLQGYGLKSISQMLNEQKRKTPGQMQLELLKKRLPKQHDHILKKYIWDASMVSRILRDESYAGTLICHKSERDKINKLYRVMSPKEQFRHENFLPVIIPQELWEQVQLLMERRKAQKVSAAPNQKIHRYCGLLSCVDCGRAFTAKRRRSKRGERVEYICSTYHRYGKEHCTSHAINETDLDELLRQELLATKDQFQKQWDELEEAIESWSPNTLDVQSQIQKQQTQIDLLTDDIERILMERIRNMQNSSYYDRMIQKREEQIAVAKKRIAELNDLRRTIRDRQSRIRKDIGMLDEILARGKMTESQLRLLVEKIYVYESDEGISLDIKIRAPFQNHTDTYKDGELTNSELEALLKAV